MSAEVATQRWALGGRIVTTVEEAKTVQAAAIKCGNLYLLPQCRNVIAKLRKAQGVTA